MQLPNLEIRWGNVDDLDAIVHIEIEAFLFQDRKTEKEIFEYLDPALMPFNSCMVATVRGKVIAYVLFKIQEQYFSCGIERFATHKDWRQKGVAKILLSTVVKKAKVVGQKMTVYAPVNGDNQAANRALRTNGFKAKRFYRKSNTWIMELWYDIQEQNQGSPTSTGGGPRCA